MKVNLHMPMYGPVRIKMQSGENISKVQIKLQGRGRVFWGDI